MSTMSTKIGDVAISFLKGSENYHLWKFRIIRILSTKNVDHCIKAGGKEIKPEEDKKAMDYLCLAIEEQIIPHIQECKTAIEIWNALEKMYDDKSLVKKVSLLKQLGVLSLEDCNDMEDYINKVIDITNKLNQMGFKYDEQVIIVNLFKGLGDEYKPLIMALEGSEANLTVDKVKLKLLDQKLDNKSSETALLAKKKFQKWNNQNIPNKLKCYNCNETGHFSRDCKQPKREKNDYGNNNSGVTNKNCFMMLQNENHMLLKCDADHVANVCMHEKNNWIVDSGASSHMTPHRDILTNCKESTTCTITAANSEKLSVKAVGNSCIKLNDMQVEVKNVLLVPKLSTNLLSVSKIVEMGNSVTFNKNGCTVYNSENEIIVTCGQQDGVYKFSGEEIKSFVAMKSENEAMMWHRRFGHINYQSLVKMKNGLVDGMNFENDESAIKSCDVCPQGKQCVLPFEKSSRKTTEILQLIHSDLAGPMETQSVGKAKYLLTFIDDFSRKVFVYFLSSKNEVFSKFVEFKKFIENQTDKKIKVLRSDNGGEYVTNQMDSFCKESGILHQKTTAFTPQQNGVAERMNRSLIEKAKCLLFDAKLPKMYWAEAVNHASYLINRSLASAHGEIPNEVFFNIKVNVSDLKLFGTKCWVLVPKKKRLKWDKNSLQLIFLGYDQFTKGFRCVDIKTRKMTISRNVKFMEADTDKCAEFSLDEPETEGHILNEEDGEDTSDSERQELEEQQTPKDEVVVNPPPVAPKQAKGSRIPEPKPVPAVTRSKTKAGTPSFASLAIIDENFTVKCTEENHMNDPLTVSELNARKDRELWKAAMTDEFESLIEKNTWDLVPLPPQKRVVRSKWLFKTKRNVDEEIYLKQAGRMWNIKLDTTLKEIGLKNPSSTSTDFSKLSDEDAEAVDVPYQEAIGSLLYAAQGTRPDIAYAVNFLSKFNKNFKAAHWKAVKRVFRYLRGTINYCLSYNFRNSKLIGYCDSDWASEAADRKSVTGYIFKLANGTVSWCSKKQPIMALSSTEAEYIALGSAAQEALWIQQLLREFWKEADKSVEIWCDNQSTIKLASSEAYRPRTKHIDVKFHFLRSHVEKGDIAVKYVNTNENNADMLTKAISSEKFKFHCTQVFDLE